MWDWARNNGAVVSFSWNDSPVLISFLNSLDEILHLFFSKQCLRSSQSLSRILLWFWNKISRHLWSMGEFQLCTRSRLCPRRKKAMVGEGEKKGKREPPLPLIFFRPSSPLRHSGYTRPKSLCHSANMETKMEKDKDQAWSYSQTRSSVPVANELMNSFTEKWFRLLIQ